MAGCSRRRHRQLVMSLDNVIAVAAAAKGNYCCWGSDWPSSIPVVIAGRALFLALLEGRFRRSCGPAGPCWDGFAGGLLPDGRHRFAVHRQDVRNAHRAQSVAGCTGDFGRPLRPQRNSRSRPTIRGWEAPVG